MSIDQGRTPAAANLTRRALTRAALTLAGLPAPAQSGRFTAISYNVLACLGFAGKVPNPWRLDAAREQMGMRTAQELLLYRPDVITMSESVTRPAAERLARALDMRMAYFDPGVPSYQGYPIGFPGTVFTRGRIVESENAPYRGGPKDPALFTRHWGRAVIETDRERIALFSGHLHPNRADIREREITIMLDVMKDEIARGRSVLFHGDLNHTPDGPEYARWKAAGLTDSFAARGTGSGLTFNSVQPKARIDYIWVSGPLAARLVEARVLNEGAFRTNPDDPQSFALSDHLPVLAQFQL